jgi:hypothetical protein
VRAGAYLGKKSPTGARRKRGDKMEDLKNALIRYLVKTTNVHSETVYTILEYGGKSRFKTALECLEEKKGGNKNA